MQVAPLFASVASSLVASTVSAVAIVAAFYFRYHSLLIYQMSIEGDLSKEPILPVVLTSVVATVVLSGICSIGIGLVASQIFPPPFQKKRS